MRADERPNILFIMTDQQRFDTIAALGSKRAITPNLDRLVARGIACTNAYTPCPVCVPSRYSLMSGYDPSKTGWFSNWQDTPNVRANCGPYLAERLTGAGYRTFGFGKFHTEPRDEPLGFEVQEYSEELWPTEADFVNDHYVQWLRKQSRAFEHLEQVHGERTDMYYVPQSRAQPAELCSEAWLALRTCEEVDRVTDKRPYFGFVSFVQPHPPIAPPIPYNRLFNPDEMPDPVIGDPEINQADDYLGWMNHAVWAENISTPLARQIRARYYASITFIDDCVGRILDAVERRPDADNTLICFFSDHGDHLGDHGAWQKESFFEASCRVPMLVSWPKRWGGGVTNPDLVSLVDLFGLATCAAGVSEFRDGHDIAGVFDGQAVSREYLFGTFGSPGTNKFKAMVRHQEWKYIWLANGGRELLFNLSDDPDETRSLHEQAPEVAAHLRGVLIEHLGERAVTHPALQGKNLLSLPFAPLPRVRIKQFARGVTDFGQISVYV